MRLLLALLAASAAASPLNDLYAMLNDADSLLAAAKEKQKSANQKFKEYEALQQAADANLKASEEKRENANAAYAAALFTFEKSDVGKCAKRVREHCHLSQVDYLQMDANVEACKHVESQHIELFQLKETGKVVVVHTSGKNVNIECPRTVYTIDTEGIKTMKIIGPTPFFLANSGKVYALLSEDGIYEIRSGKGSSYVADSIAGGADKIILSLNKAHGGGVVEWTLEKLNKFVESGSKQARKLEFKRTTTYKSLFRDEL